MTDIPFRYEQRICFSYSHMEKLIEETYTRKLNILSRYAEFMGNYSFTELDVFKGQFPDYIPEEMDEWNDDDAESLVYQWVANGGDIDDQLVIWHLMYTGKIPEGKYLMKLEW